MRAVFLLLVLESAALAGGPALPPGVSQVSRDGGRAMIAYMGLSPESPDGAKLAYFEIERAAPRLAKLYPGRLILADRDGRNAHAISGIIRGNTHTGVRPQWLDKKSVAYFDEEKGETKIYSLETGRTTAVTGELEQFSPQQGRLLLKLKKDKASGKGSRLVSVGWPVERGLSDVLTNEQAAAMIPGCAADEFCARKGKLKIAKWSPDGRHAFVSFRAKDKGGRFPGRKTIKKMFFVDSATGAVTFMDSYGQHPMWLDDRTVHYYSRRDGVQDVVGLDLGGKSRVLISSALGVHGSFAPGGHQFVTDVYDWPNKGRAALLLYDDPAAGRYKVLAEMPLPPHVARNRIHLHPAWSADGQRIYFTGMFTGDRRLYVYDMRYFVER